MLTAQLPGHPDWCGCYGCSPKNPKNQRVVSYKVTEDGLPADEDFQKWIKKGLTFCELFANQPQDAPR